VALIQKDLKAARRAARLFGVLALVVLLVAGVAYGLWRTEPTEQELKERAGLIGKRELRIGVIGDMPGVSLLDPKTGQFSGFDIDIAYLVAADLGFRPHEVRFFVIRNEDRETMRAFDGVKYVTVDLVIAAFSITKEREALPNVTFSAPYLRTELSVATRDDHATVQSLEDLRGRAVCTLTTSTSNDPLHLAGVQLTGKNTISECESGVLTGQFDAMSTDAAILAGFVQRSGGRLVFNDIGQSGEEHWGINLGDNEALRDLVNLSLCKSLYDPNDHRWEDAFEKYLRQPDQSQDIAVDEQPDVAKVRVRALPGKLPDECH
jgi:glutamate transport system substrate-binding protein